MGFLIFQILLFLLLAALLGLVIGWLLSDVRTRAKLQDLDARWRRRLSEVEGDRDRFVAELNQANEARGRAESALASSQRPPAAGSGPEVVRLQEELAVARQHALGLEQELGRARQLYADYRAEVARERAAAPAPALGLMTEEPAAAPPAAPAVASAPPAAADEPPGTKPEGLSAAQGAPDDLKLISGVGPKIERTLHELGIFHFWQIAQFTRENVAWVDRYLSFKGRIDRERWIDQAKVLAAGGQPEPGQRHHV